MAPLNEYLDILGQQPGFNIYTQICLCYDLPDTSARPSIIQTLEAGLERLSVSFPWIAGQVVREEAGSDQNPGLYKIVPFEATPRFVVKDLTGDESAMTMAQLRGAEFPMRMLDESVVAPRGTLPGVLGEKPSDPYPVFFVQVTFIAGGVLVTFVAHHGTMDMTGQGQMIDLLDKACRSEAFTEDEVAVGNMARQHLIPLLDEETEIAALTAYQRLTATKAERVDVPPEECSWAYFSFTAAALGELKKIAMRDVDPIIGYISTDDALTAFIWQSVSRIRQDRILPTTVVKLARAVNVRRYLDIPATYPGLIQNMTYHAMQHSQLVAAPLGVLASDLRAAVDTRTTKLGRATRAFATLLSRPSDGTAVGVMASFDSAVDVALSSWAAVDCYELDFGLGLGKPISVRRPQFTPVENLFYLMPRSRDGEIAAGLCLRGRDMERLRADGEFGRFGRYIG